MDSKPTYALSVLDLKRWSVWKYTKRDAISTHPPSIPGAGIDRAAPVAGRFKTLYIRAMLAKHPMGTLLDRDAALPARTSILCRMAEIWA